jgi:hypothetical protein
MSRCNAAKHVAERDTLATNTAVPSLHPAFLESVFILHRGQARAIQLAIQAGEPWPIPSNFHGLL